jgi:hypothetical protein
VFAAGGKILIRPGLSFLSPRTVEMHVQGCPLKLSSRTRAAGNTCAGIAISEVICQIRCRRRFHLASAVVVQRAAVLRVSFIRAG